MNRDDAHEAAHQESLLEREWLAKQAERARDIQNEMNKTRSEDDKG